MDCAISCWGAERSRGNPARGGVGGGGVITLLGLLAPQGPGPWRAERQSVPAVFGDPAVFGGSRRVPPAPGGNLGISRRTGRRHARRRATAASAADQSWTATWSLPVWLAPVPTEFNTCDALGSDRAHPP